MIAFEAIIERFGAMGEKTGWTFVTIPQQKALLLRDEKRSFRVKGRLGGHPIQQTAMLPMGEGNFIIPLNNAIRKGIGPAAHEGTAIRVELEVDDSPLTLDVDLMACLTDVPEAFAAFDQMPGSHQRYFSKWVQEAKTEATRTKRIAMAVEAMLRGMDFGQMIRWGRERVQG